MMVTDGVKKYRGNVSNLLSHLGSAGSEWWAYNTGAYNTVTV
jgi:hypothetical protein